MNTKSKVLIVDDDAAFATLLQSRFTQLGWQTQCWNAAGDFGLYLTTQPAFTHAVLDLNLKGNSGLALIAPLLTHSPGCRIVVLTGFASISTSIEAIKLGAQYLLAKPSRFSEILAAFDHNPNPSETGSTTLTNPISIDLQERETIQRALTANQFNISKTAQALGMHRRTLQRKLKKLI